MTEPQARLATALADRYRIERAIGAGGMATVYLAEDLKHKRKVALKVLKPELAAVLGAERFVQEITTTAALQHPHILPLFDSGTADGFLFYVMPFIDGETLRAKLDRETKLGVDDAVRIAREVLDALEHAHQHGIVHRDIKPENILLHGGHAMVADFGIALAVSAAAGGRMTETGLSLGTPHYMSPEQATAEKVITARSDVYSLGSVLYEMLAGQPPHLGGSAQQIIMKIIAEPVDDPGGALGVPLGEPGDLVAPHGPAAQDRALDPEAVEQLAEIFDQRFVVVRTGGRMIGLAMAPPGIGDDVVSVGERGGDIVEGMGRIAHAVDQHQAVSGPAPIEDVERNPVDLNEPGLMRRRVGPGVCHGRGLRERRGLVGAGREGDDCRQRQHAHGKLRGLKYSVSGTRTIAPEPGRGQGRSLRSGRTVNPPWIGTGLSSLSGAGRRTAPRSSTHGQARARAGSSETRRDT